MYKVRRKLAITDLVAYTKSITNIIEKAEKDSPIKKNYKLIRKFW